MQPSDAGSRKHELPPWEANQGGISSLVKPMFIWPGSRKAHENLSPFCP